MVVFRHRLLFEGRARAADEARAVVVVDRHDAEEVAGLALPIGQASATRPRRPGSSPLPARRARQRLPQRRPEAHFYGRQRCHLAGSAATVWRMQARLCEWCAQLCLRRSFGARRSRAFDRQQLSCFCDRLLATRGCALAAAAGERLESRAAASPARVWRLADEQRSELLCVSPSSLTELSAGKGVQCKGKPALQCSHQSARRRRRRGSSHSHQLGTCAAAASAKGQMAQDGAFDEDWFELSAPAATRAGRAAALAVQLGTARSRHVDGSATSPRASRACRRTPRARASTSGGATET